MPRVVAEQRQKFENDDLFRKMSRETEVIWQFQRYITKLLTHMVTIDGFFWINFIHFQIKYTGYRDRSHEERIVRFQTEARDGQANVVSWSNVFLMELNKTFGETIV